MSKVLLVEDDLGLLVEIRQWLQHENYLVETATDGRSALELLQSYSYDVIVLDWNLPKVSGVEVLAQFRQKSGKTPVLLLTGRTHLDDKEYGLDVGADDYLTKPFQFRELSARLRSLLRRPREMTGNVLRCGELTLEPGAGRVTGGGKEINLLPKELALLEFLMRHPNQAFNGEALLTRVWSSESEASMNTVKSFIYLLRKKLASAGYDSLIQTAHGHGYKLVTPEHTAGTNSPAEDI
jgi:DNA-binding response OmpR family regulator